MRVQVTPKEDMAVAQFEAQMFIEDNKQENKQNSTTYIQCEPLPPPKEKVQRQCYIQTSSITRIKKGYSICPFGRK